MKTTGVNMGDVKTTNRACVLRLLLANGSMSRTDIASTLQLTTATLTSICNDFIGKGLLLQKEEAYESSHVGRKKYPIAINYNFKYIVCIDLYPHQATLSITNLRGHLIGSETLPVTSPPDPDHYFKNLASNCIRLLWQNNISSSQVLGAGVTVIGPVDHLTGTSLHAFNIFSHQVPVKDLLEKHVPFPVCVESNVSAHLIAELLFGELPDVQNVLLLKWGPGVGSASFINGVSYKGCNFYSSELGHTFAKANGKLCQCGKHGCLETEVSIQAIAEKLEELAEEDKVLRETALAHPLVSGRNLEYYMQAGNKEFAGFMNSAIFTLAVAVNNAIQVLSPDKVILFGDIFESPVMTERFISQITSVNPELQPHLFMPSSLSEKKHYIGASAVALKTLLIDNGGVLI